MSSRRRLRLRPGTLRSLLAVAPFVPLDPRGSTVDRSPRLYIVAYCPNPRCGARSIWRPADWLAERIENWPPPDAVLLRPSRLHGYTVPLVAELDPEDSGDILHPTLAAPPGKIPSVLRCYVCGRVLRHYQIDGDKRSARLGW